MPINNNSTSMEEFVDIPKVLLCVIDKKETTKLEKFLDEKHINFNILLKGKGTASSEILREFGLSGTDKTICLCVEPMSRIQSIMPALTERMELTLPGHGIAVLMAVSSISNVIKYIFKEINANSTVNIIHREVDKNMNAENNNGDIVEPKDDKYDLIFAIINHGFSETLMDAARSAGARGGTIIDARHSGLKSDLWHNLTIQPEKEVIMIAIRKSQKSALMQSITQVCGYNTAAKGIILSVPLDSCIGIDMPKV